MFEGQYFNLYFQNQTWAERLCPVASDEPRYKVVNLFDSLIILHKAGCIGKIVVLWSTYHIKWMFFRTRFCTYKAILGRGQYVLMVQTFFHKQHRIFCSIRKCIYFVKPRCRTKTLKLFLKTWANEIKFVMNHAPGAGSIYRFIIWYMKIRNVIFINRSRPTKVQNYVL